MSELTFNLPDVGEGLTEAEIVQWKVAVGDTVAVNDVLVEIETAKSLVELPSPFEGVVGSILVDEGTTVDVGTAIITVGAVNGAPDAAAPATPADDASAVATDAAASVSVEADDKPGAVLVGHGSSASAGSRRRRMRSHAAPHETLAAPAVHAPAAPVAPAAAPAAPATSAPRTPAPAASSALATCNG